MIFLVQFHRMFGYMCLWVPMIFKALCLEALDIGPRMTGAPPVTPRTLAGLVTCLAPRHDSCFDLMCDGIRHTAFGGSNVVVLFLFIDTDYVSWPSRCLGAHLWKLWTRSAKRLWELLIKWLENKHSSEFHNDLWHAEGGLSSLLLNVGRYRQSPHGNLFLSV